MAPTCGRAPGNWCEVKSQFQVLKGLESDLESVQTLFHVYLEQKAKLAVQGECAAQKRLSEAEAEMDMRNMEQTNREIESQRLELCDAESMGRSGSKTKDQFIWRIGNEKQTLPRKSRKKMPRH